MLPALIERARQEVVLARVVGKFTVDFGIASVRRRLIGDSEPVTDLSVDSLVDLSEANETIPAEPVREQPVRQERVGEKTVREETTQSTVRPEQLVLPDYDLLPAAHIVAKLASLTQGERDAVEEYETAHRHRRTILGKLDQLRTSP